MITDYQRYRIYEILPGLSVWGTIVAALFLSWFRPLVVIYAIILFDIYWVLKVINYIVYLLIATRRYYVTTRIDWKAKLSHEIADKNQYQHVVFLPVYNESWDVVETTVERIAASVYDRQRLTLVIAGEARMGEHCKDLFTRIEQAFSSQFADIVTVLHPAGLAGEIPGKGSNIHYAERHMKSYIDAKGWAYEDVIATIFDTDTICHEQYFAHLTYLYAKHPRPTRSSFQPVALYSNNLWDSPAILRVMSFGTTFWMMTSLARQDALVTFSSHSMSWQAIVDAGFHDKRIVSEDSRIFYQCLLKYNGDYEVTPMYLPVSMDTVRDDKWTTSIKNLYKQQRRWAWGCEHIPFLLWEFGKKGREFPFWKKVKWVFIEWEGKWSWALVPIILTLFGRLPLWLASDVVPAWMRSPQNISSSALFVNAPHLMGTLMLYALAGLFVSALLSFPLLPRRPSSHPKHIYIIMALQWLLLPVSMIFIGSIPALDSLTHMMRGDYLGFNVSQKKRKTV